MSSFFYPYPRDSLKSLIVAIPNFPLILLAILSLVLQVFYNIKTDALTTAKMVPEAQGDEAQRGSWVGATWVTALIDSCNFPILSFSDGYGCIIGNYLDRGRRGRRYIAVGELCRQTERSKHPNVYSKTGTKIVAKIFADKYAASREALFFQRAFSDSGPRLIAVR